MNYDALVVGGGVVGMSIAYHLVCEGARTLLIDRVDRGRATDAGAGILAPETNSRDSDAWFDFAIEAVGYYPSLIARLREEQAGDTGYAICGQLTVAVSEDEVTPFGAARRVVLARQQQRGLPTREDLRQMLSDEAQAIFPPLAPVQGALYYRHAARIDGRLLAAALQRAALARGLIMQHASVERVVVQDHVATGVIADGEMLRAAAVAIAGGAWSNHFGEQLGITIPIVPQRGQIIHLDLPGIDTGAWPIVNAFRGHYLVAWNDSRVVVGATREAGSGYAAHTTAAGVHEVLSEALRVAPGLANAAIREIRVGLRPASPDGLPVIGAIPTVQNIYVATGHGPTGLQLGPYSGKIVADLMLGRANTTDIAAFAVTRFVSERGVR